MSTVLLLLPVLCILVWLYWYLLPHRSWRLADTVILVTVLAVAAAFIAIVEPMRFAGAGPMWSHIVAAAGSYTILAVGLAAGLAWRRRR